MDSNVLFVRSNDQEPTPLNHDEIWDDTALIQAYDKAVNLAKEEVAKRMNMKTQATQPQKEIKSTRKWTMGSPCRVVYSADGEVYEAVISKIHENKGTCIVKFVGYGNSEKVKLSALMESEGLESQIAQQKTASAGAPENRENCQSSSTEQMEYDTENWKSFKRYSGVPGSSFDGMFSTMPPAPPLPPQLMAKLPENDADALSSMLMSWYISGFHTGYYHGLKQAREKSTTNKI